MAFKKIRSVRLPYREQGAIYFACINYEKQPKRVQEKIRRLCRECGGEYEKALFVFLTRESVTAEWVAQHYYVSDSVLYECRRKFYMAFAREK